ncbi:MAG: putative toxin-antitoxin system toxin component, PIN family [Legionellales bacterium RIFCSPHIGHO2_12_FULL_35_11]|nr:MAG: putative toxin-antitoxin system toxin component, PIN family [Legionellales bacterium RIFCSPHIGHO2_12_FULL_35_11]
MKEPVSRDADDDKFIATALAAKCKLIVSGDKDLLTVDGCFSIELIKPNEFVNKYLA